MKTLLKASAIALLASGALTACGSGDEDDEDIDTEIATEDRVDEEETFHTQGEDTGLGDAEGTQMEDPGGTEPDASSAARTMETETADTGLGDAEGTQWDFAQTQYLEEYAARDNVYRRESGLLYRVEREGTGQSPEPGDTVRVHYEGKLTSGDIFDSSYKRGEPAEFPTDRLIPAWQEILPLMEEGDRWEVVTPPDLAYGARGAGETIPPNSTLIFTIELIEVKKS